MTLPERIRELVQRHGSLRAAAAVLRCDHAYLCRMQHGEKSEPSKEFLRKLGLRKIVIYERSKP